MIYNIPYNASIWDVAGSTVGVANILDVVSLAGGWDTELTDLWATPVFLPDYPVKQTALQPRFIVEEIPDTLETTVLFAQNVYDVALHVYGDASKAFTVLIDNNLGFNDIISQGEILTYSTKNDQTRLLKEVTKRNIKFVTDDINEAFTSENTLIITEAGEYLTTEDGVYLII